MDTSPRSQIESLLHLINSSAHEAISEYEKTSSGVPSPGAMDSHPLDNEAGAIALRTAIRTLESACERLCSTLAQPMHTLANRAMAYEAPCLKVAVEHKIADIIDTSPKGEGMHVNDIAAKAKMGPEKLRQIMLFLATRGCFTEVSKDVYANNRISLPLLSSNPVSSVVSLASGEHLRAANVLAGALADPEYAYSAASQRTSFSFLVRKEMENASYYDWVEKNPYARQFFQHSMIGYSTLVGSIDSVVQVYPWGDLTPPGSRDQLTFCDVGSGPGAVGLSLSKHFAAPNKFKFVLQDRAGPLEQAKTVWSSENPGADVSFTPMNFLQESPVAGQDFYYLGWIIHNWPDLEAVTILKNISSVMDKTSRVLLHEYVLQHAYREPQSSQTPDDEMHQAPEPLLPNYGTGSIRCHSMGIEMLAAYNSNERTREEFAELGQRAGLTLVKVWPLSETCLIEFKLAV